jgi:hypothetical protein
MYEYEVRQIEPMIVAVTYLQQPLYINIGRDARPGRVDPHTPRVHIGDLQQVACSCLLKGMPMRLSRKHTHNICLAGIGQLVRTHRGQDTA